MKKYTELRENLAPKSLIRTNITSRNVSDQKRNISKLGFKENPKSLSLQQTKSGYSSQSSLKKELDVPSQTLKKKIVTPKQPSLSSKVQLNMGEEITPSDAGKKEAKKILQKDADKRLISRAKMGIHDVKALGEVKKWGYEKYRETSVATTGKTPEQRTKEIEDIQAKLKQQKAEFEVRHAKKDVSETNQTPPFEPNKSSKPVTPGKHGQEYSKVRHLARMAMKKAAEKKDMSEATYQGKKVPLNKPMPGDVAKSKVYVDPDGDGKAQKVNFGDKTMTIKKNQPARKKSFLARHNCDDKKDKTTAGYWSCRAWK
jgi:hypothetical protein